MPRKKGYKHSKGERSAIAEGMRTHHARIREILSHVKTPKSFKLKGGKPHHKPDPPSTPIPPSAGSISNPTLQRWGIYSLNAEGRYYYKREHADSLKLLQRLARSLDLKPPLWTYVKSAHTEDELFLPIRIPEDIIRTLGHRFSKFNPKRKA